MTDPTPADQALDVWPPDDAKLASLLRRMIAYANAGGSKAEAAVTASKLFLFLSLYRDQFSTDDQRKLSELVNNLLGGARPGQ